MFSWICDRTDGGRFSRFCNANSLLKPGAEVSCTGYIDEIKSRGKLIMGTSF